MLLARCCFSLATSTFLLHSSGTPVAKSFFRRSEVAKRSSRRELIDTGRNKMYARRDEKGQFREMDDTGRALAGDRRTKARRRVKSGHGDKGDR